MTTDEERPEWLIDTEKNTLQVLLRFCFLLFVVVPVFVAIGAVLWIRDRLRRQD